MESMALYTKDETIEVYEEYNKKKELRLKRVKKLDEKNLAYEQTYHYSGKAPRKILFEYDINGLIIKRVGLGENGEPETIEVTERK